MLGHRMISGTQAKLLAFGICSRRMWPATRGLRHAGSQQFTTTRTSRKEVPRTIEASASSLAGVDEHGHGSAIRRDNTGAGSLELIIGPMFAGKTSALLNRIAAHEALQLRVIAVKSAKDTRYGVGELATHDGVSRVCIAVANLSELKQRWRAEYDNAEVVAIDEGQFFPDLEEFCCTAADEDGKQVIVAGLDGDFRRERFGQMLDLIPKADAVSKLSSWCTYCAAAGVQKPALFSLRIAADDRQEVVGGTDKYAPVCRHHYNSLCKLRRPEAQPVSLGE